MKTYEEVKDMVKRFITIDDFVIEDLEEFLRLQIELENPMPKIYTTDNHLLSIEADHILDHIREGDYWLSCPEDWEFEYDDKDVEILQEALDKIIFRNESNNTSYSAAEQIDITDIYNKLKKG